MKIAVDAMGGDYAPGVVVEGTAAALCDFPACEVVLVGHEAKLRFYLEKYGLTGHPRLRLVHAPEVVEMRELSSTSLRTKKHSSITECAHLGTAATTLVDRQAGATRRMAERIHSFRIR